MATFADRVRGALRHGTAAPPVTAAPAPPTPAHDVASPPAIVEPDRAARAARALDGTVVEIDGRPCVCVDRWYPAEYRHGTVTMGDCVRWVRPDAAGLSCLPGGPAVAAGGEGPLLFVDLETTGLAGGAGTYAFLVGCAHVDRGGFRVRQLLLPGQAFERPLLALVEQLAGDASGLVTYNGRSFDVPLLELRFQFNRLAPPFGAIGHVDMLHAARRLWRGLSPVAYGAPAPSCTLTDLERVLFGVRRHGDVPGFEIPGRYFRFIRSGDAAPLAPVLEHNRLDLLSLAAMLTRAVRLLEDAPHGSTSARECLGAGRILEQAGFTERAAQCYELAARRASEERSADRREVRVEALRRLALRRRRDGCYDAAADAWSTLVRDEWTTPVVRREALEALAIHCEHRARDLTAARRYAEQSLGFECSGMVQAAVRHRLARLDRKLGAAPGETPGATRLWGDAG